MFLLINKFYQHPDLQQDKTLSFFKREYIIIPFITAQIKVIKEILIIYFLCFMFLNPENARNR